MKKLLVVLTIALFAMAGCKKKEDVASDAELKFARYKVSVYKDKEMKTWLATLEKAESVQLLDEKDSTNAKNEDVIIAKVKLADDKEGFVEMKHLADKVIVFTADTKALIRPTAGSKEKGTIPKGTIAFVTADKDGWIQVYVGKLNNIWFTQEWVGSGYTTDESIVLDAREYETAVAAEAAGKNDDAVAIYKKLMDKSNVIGELSKAKLVSLGVISAEEQAEVSSDEGSDDSSAEETSESGSSEESQ